MLPLGGAVTGGGIALTISRQPILRYAATTFLAGATVASLDNVPAITYAVIAALTWWALNTAAHTTRGRVHSLAQ